VDIYTLAKETIIENSGLARNVDFQKNGLSNSQITYLCNRGFLERVRRGYYQLSSDENSSDEAIIAQLFPDGIVCMDSALFHYGYSDRTPLAWTIAFTRSVTRTRLNVKVLRLKPYFVPEELYLLGKSEESFNDVKLAIYDRDRVICDCFKYQRKIDSEMFNKAIVAYSKDAERNLGNLIVYAKKMRVYKKMVDIMGVLING